MHPHLTIVYKIVKIKFDYYYCWQTLSENRYSSLSFTKYIYFFRNFSCEDFPLVKNILCSLDCFCHSFQYKATQLLAYWHFSLFSLVFFFGGGFGFAFLHIDSYHFSPWLRRNNCFKHQTSSLVAYMLFSYGLVATP